MKENFGVLWAFQFSRVFSWNCTAEQLPKHWYCARVQKRSYNTKGNGIVFQASSSSSFLNIVVLWQRFFLWEDDLFFCSFVCLFLIVMLFSVTDYTVCAADCLFCFVFCFVCFECVQRISCSMICSYCHFVWNKSSIVDLSGRWWLVLFMFPYNENGAQALICAVFHQLSFWVHGLKVCVFLSHVC